MGDRTRRELAWADPAVMGAALDDGDAGDWPCSREAGALLAEHGARARLRVGAHTPDAMSWELRSGAG